MSSPSDMTTQEQITVLEHAKRVQAVSAKILDILVTETADLKGGCRWLLMSRIVTTVFQHHFNIALSGVGSAMKKREDAQAEEAQPQGDTPPPSVL